MFSGKIESYHVIPKVPIFARYNVALCEFCKYLISHQIYCLSKAKNKERHDEGWGNLPSHTWEFSACALCKFIRTLFIEGRVIPSTSLSATSNAPRNDTPDIGHIDISSQGGSFPLATRLTDSTPHTPIWRSSGQGEPTDRLVIPEGWLENCRNSHERCIGWRKTYKFTCPTRLLNVSQPTPKLVSLDKTASPSYAVLSHCWGNGQPLITTKSNLEKHMTSIDPKLLPKTFLDAITTTQRLGIYYLWIDSLCIVQDDAKDWEKEAANMAAIYESAEITIAAAWASNGSGGCFHDPVPAFKVAVYEAEDSKEPSAQLYIRHDTRGDIPLRSGSPLTARKWTLQESLLSPRTLIFAQDQMYWSCMSLQTSEDDLAEGEEYAFTPWRSVHSSEVDEASRRSVKVRNESWARTINNYQGRNLTFASDKLNAIAGVTKAYQRIFGDEPLLGIWQNDLLRSLFWWGTTGYRERHVHDVGERRLDEEAITALNLPSWTWMKMKKSVTADNRSTVIQPYFIKTETKITWSGIPLTSKVVEATISGRGKLLRITGLKSMWEALSDKCMCAMGTLFVENHAGLKKELKTSQYFIDDCVLELPEDVFCLLGCEMEISNGGSGNEPKRAIRCLLVARKSFATSTTYTRIGVVSLAEVSQELLDSVQEQEIALV